MTDEDHQELGAWRLAARLTGAIDETASCRKTTPDDVLRMVKFLRDQLAEASEGGFAKLKGLLARCPLGYHDGKIVTHRSTEDVDVIEWLKELQQVECGQVKSERELREKLRSIEAERDELRKQNEFLSSEQVRLIQEREQVRAERDAAEKRAQGAEAVYVRDARMRFDAVAERDREREGRTEDLRVITQQVKNLDELRERLRAVEAERDDACAMSNRWRASDQRARDQLRTAEAVRDDARAASARDLELRRQAILQARREFDRIQGEACFGAHTFVGDCCRDCGLAAPIGAPCSVCGGPSGVVGPAPDVVVTCGRCAGKSIKHEPRLDRCTSTCSSCYLDGWRKGVLDANDKLWAAHASSVLINNDKIFELLNILLQHPPTEKVTHG